MVAFDTRKAAFRVFFAGVAGVILGPPAIYFIGLSLAPPRPVPAQSPVPPLVADAIWARANGGRASELRPVTALSMAEFAACLAYEDFWDTTPGDQKRIEACQEHMPAIEAMAYLSGVHMRESGLEPSFREGIGRFSTTIWLTHSWTRAELLRTLAERGEFGRGFRGLEAASRGFFGRPAGELTLPEAAMIGALIGDRRIDPWCDPAGAATMRGRILERMRDNQVIDDASFEAATVAELGLAAPPADHKACRD